VRVDDEPKLPPDVRVLAPPNDPRLPDADPNELLPVRRPTEL